MIWDASIASKIDKWWFIGTPHQKIVIVSIMATGGASLTILVVGTLETPKVNKKNLGKNGRWKELPHNETEPTMTDTWSPS